MTAFCEPAPHFAELLRGASGRPGPVFASAERLYEHLSIALDEATVVVGPSVELPEALKLAEAMRISRPRLGVILIRRMVDATLLTEALRAGVREVLSEHQLADLRSAIDRSELLSAALQKQPGAAPASSGRPPGRVVTVFSAKGGCGKTTLATNLAVALADRGRRQVCLVDLDLAFGDVAIALQLFPEHTIADAIPLVNDLDYTGLQALLTTHSPGLMVLVAPLEPGVAASISAELVTKVLTVLRDNFDYVVVDTPPALDNEQVLAAFDLSDLLALIATLDVPALKNLKLTLETLDLLNFLREKAKIVLNRADSKVGLSLVEVEKSLNTAISLQIPSSRDVPAAINRGVPIMLDDPKHPVSVSIRSFAERFITGGIGSRRPGGDGGNGGGGNSPGPGNDRRGRRRRFLGRNDDQ
jgi:pilus assembly protein CpaE